MKLTKRKFESLTLIQKHKYCLKLLLKRLKSACHASLDEYNSLSLLTGFSQLLNAPIDEISKRYYDHLSNTGVMITDETFLETQVDRINYTVPISKIHTYLHNLRSAHNVGSIIRTANCFSLGPIICGGYTPGIEHASVEKTSMNASKYHPVKKSSLQSCPKPWIAVEIDKGSTPIEKFTFRENTCTIIMGNEQFGIENCILKQCDEVITIPMFGNKASLNVGCAYAIVAQKMREQYEQNR
ncbi:hypothetical protein N9N03_02720 [Chlamydiia bacterium]|nr:hypothetical protein [Chlamydiia bacterium]